MMGTSAQKRRTRRNTVRFVKELVGGKNAIVRSDGAAEVQARGAKRILEPAALHLLLRAGILVRNGTYIKAGSVASAWVRRHLATTEPFQAQHRVVSALGSSVARNLEASAILKLGHAKSGEAYLSPHHLAAAERVAQWAEQARLSRRITMSYSPLTAGGGKRGGDAGGDISDMAVDARRKLNALYTSLPKECAQALMDVCVYDKGLSEIEREHQWPRRSAKLVLRIGLDMLAGQLGLGARATGKQALPQRGWRDDQTSAKAPQ